MEIEPLNFDKLMVEPESQRDERWEQEFLKLAPGLKVQVEAGGECTTGPDGWPYLMVKTGEGSEPLVRVLQWLAGRGIGLVVNAHKMTPDYVFTAGMIWHFVERGRFVEPQTDLQPQVSQVSLTDKTLFGPPTDEYLPEYVRTCMREFLKQQGVEQPQILVATSPDYSQTDLLFSLKSLEGDKGELGPHDQKDLAQALAWFLPLHYSIVMAETSAIRGWVDL